jgi:hypothetical protein
MSLTGFKQILKLSTDAYRKMRLYSVVGGQRIKIYDAQQLNAADIKTLLETHLNKTVDIVKDNQDIIVTILEDTSNIRGGLVDYKSKIQETAYFLAEARNFEPGHELEDWVTAKNMVLQGVLSK